MSIYILTEDKQDDDIESLVILACDGDIILAPSIKTMNVITKRLQEVKPTTLVHVRLNSFKYFPSVGKEQEVEL